MVVKMSDLKEMALKKMSKNLPKTKKGLEDFIHGVSAPALAPAPKKELPAEVKVAKEHLKKVDCKVVPHTEMDDMKNHKEVVKHLESKECPEVGEVKKKVKAHKKAEKAEKSEPKSEPVVEAPKAKKPRAKKVKADVPEVLY
jgi:hypothetical protein